MLNSKITSARPAEPPIPKYLLTNVADSGEVKTPEMYGTFV